MIYTRQTKQAMKLCFERHASQVDKCGVPYPFHPFHVAESMTDEESTCVALLHDLLEDTDTTEDELREMGFSDTVVEAVRLLTRPEEETYLDYVARVKRNPLARAVKMADLRHNMDLTRLDTVTEKDVRRVEKYRRALERLMEEEMEMPPRG